LDIETLELLEDLLANYQGTLLLVSHDRQFVDNTVTTSWIFEGDGVIEEFVGGYHDAQQQRLQVQKARNTEKVAPTAKQVEETPKTAVTKSKPKKLSYKLQRELEALPAKLEELEADIENLQEQVNNADFFSKPVEQTQPVLDKLAATEQELEIAFERWEELEAMQQES
jgi:ATP-binding cassette subfamily F protein uup